MASFANPIAAYSGGIHALIEVAIRDDGQSFWRFQDKGPYGYRWGAWQARAKYDAGNLPSVIEAGFSKLRAIGSGYSNWKRWRLPKSEGSAS